MRADAVETNTAEIVGNVPASSVNTAASCAPDASTETGAFGALFGRGARIFAGLAVVGSFVMPPHGVGFSICLLNNLTGLPCPGCGLTRSFACISHGQLADAVNFHPFGPLLYLWAWLGVFATIAGPVRRARAAAWFGRHPRGIRFVYGACVLLFLVFGFTRLGARIWWRTRTDLG